MQFLALLCEPPFFNLEFPSIFKYSQQSLQHFKRGGQTKEICDFVDNSRAADALSQFASCFITWISSLIRDVQRQKKHADELNICFEIITETH